MAQPTKDEIHERLNFITRLIPKARTKSEIKAAFRLQYGDMSARNIERYITKAYALMQEGLSASDKDEMRVQSLVFYRSIILRPDATDRDKIRAQAQIDKLMGLAAPSTPQNQVGVQVNFDLQGAIAAQQQADRELRGGS
jgi:hypothetical protein